ncbi:MFS general substrate transporter, partial [Aureobasidium melanogenum]
MTHNKSESLAREKDASPTEDGSIQDQRFPEPDTSNQHEPTSEKVIPYDNTVPEEQTQSTDDNDLGKYPEGGLEAWLVVLGSCVSTEYYQIILSFGVLGGLSTCFLFTTAVSAVGHWFHARRGFAMGVACTAGGTGGLAFSLIILFLAPKIGFGWAIRIIGFISAALCAVACLLLRSRLPPNKTKGAKIDILALRDPPYAATTVAIFLVEFAVFIPYTFLVDQALDGGMRQELAYALIPILNAAAIPGRLLPGYIADRYGRLNTMTVTAVICCLLTFLLWLIGSSSHAAIIAYTVLFGFWSGAAISLTPVCIQQVCKTEDIGKRTGTTFTISSFGTLIGIPIAGAILGTGAKQHYNGLIILAGASYVAASAAFVVARGLTGGWGLRVII